ncbi:aspartate aminotransferase family protein [bacterium CG_4_9_14_3_um_filter_65_15]|nr:MAG: aspartate aminotransferase family protein [bacterium CG_4_9_14_3_um_filter_65_15]
MHDSDLNPDPTPALDQKYHFPLYERYPVTLVRGQGARVWDVDGKEYIDALSGIGVNSIGHCYPAVVEAIRDQAGKLIHTSNLYYLEPQARLAKRLTEAAGMDRVFFTNSGTEAVEGALKLARRYAGKQGRSGRIVAMEGCFHGRSMGSLSAHSEKQKQNFQPLLSGFERVPFNDIEALTGAVDDQTIAVIFEPVQGEGGVRLAPDDFLVRVRELCDRTGALMILDEIQCGIGRTGRFFAFQYAGITPDILTSAKALGGGMPIGAVLAGNEVASAFESGDHGTTFGGNPLACAAADATLRVVQEEKLVERAAEMGAYLAQRIRKAAGDHPAIRELRGRGMMVGVDIGFDGKPLVAKMLERGVLANCTAETVIRFLPPLNIPREDLDTVIDVFLDLLGDEEAARN